MAGEEGFIAQLPTCPLPARIDRLLEQVPCRSLREAVVETLDLKRAIKSFRTRCLRDRELGLIRDLVEPWFVEKFVPDFQLDTYGALLEERNPYAKFKAGNKSFTETHHAILKQLDGFLLPDQEPPATSSKSSQTFDLGCSEDDVKRLTEALSEGGGLAWLIQPCIYLTHEENVALAVVDARLWLNRAPLPVVLGEKYTYEDIQHLSEDIQHSRAVKRSCTDPPCSFYVLLREATVVIYRGMREADLNLYHPDVSDFPKDGYWARFARVRYPHSSMVPEQISNLTRDLDRFGPPLDEEEVESSLGEWVRNETRNNYKLLANLIFGRQVLV